MNNLLSPFANWCCRTGINVGTLNSQFADSKDIYQAMCWIVNYLEHEVIPKVNEDVEGYNNLYAKYVEIKNFVEHYFDNLDVQEEINNKLDKMAEDGTLQEIVATYLNSNAVWCYDTYQEMVDASNLIEGSFARTSGYYAINDGGNALYIKTSSGFDIIPENASVTIKQFGAYGDDIHDDTTAIQTAINYAQAHKVKLIIPSGTYLISSVTASEKINIEGVGHDSIIKSKANNTSSYILRLLNNGMYKSELSNFRIEGNKENNTTAIDGLKLHINSEGETRDQYTLIRDITINRCTGNGFVTQGDITGYDIREIRLENINIQDCKNGIYARSCTDSLFSFVTVNTCKEHGFDISGGPHKLVSCKAFYCGKGDETSIEDIDRLPANAFTQTSDQSYSPAKTYYTRAGKGINNDWYVFSKFNGNQFVSDTTYYEMTLNYYKRYAGFIMHGSVCQMVNCEAQENYGDGVILEGSDNTITNLSVDNNGFQQASYGSLGYYTLYYGVYCKGSNSTINAVGRNLRTSLYGSQQRSVLMLNGVSNINGNVVASSQVLDYVVFQNANQSSISVTYKGKSTNYQCRLDELTEKSATLTFANSRNNITRVNDVVYINLVLNDSAGFATSVTEKTLFKLPEQYRPNGSVICEAYLSTADGWAINDKPCQIGIYSSGSVKTRAKNSSETSNATTLIATISYPVNVSYI